MMTIAIVLKSGYVHRVRCGDLTVRYNPTSGELQSMEFTKSEPGSRVLWVDFAQVAMIHREDEEA